MEREPFKVPVTFKNYRCVLPPRLVNSGLFFVLAKVKLLWCSNVYLSQNQKPVVNRLRSIMGVVPRRYRAACNLLMVLRANLKKAKW